ncbi:GtrA family protein [Brucella sp. BTU2]|nr:GtrA family protein [Ochrobactrum sp. BTU2]
MKTVGRFIIAGGVGFLVDFSLLNWMLLLGLGSILGRLISFSAAVLFTFYINRNFTFRSEGNLISQFRKYIVGSLFGLCVNWAIYAFALNYSSPQISLIIASALAMVVNFIFYRFLVFKTKT